MVLLWAVSVAHAQTSIRSDFDHDSTGFQLDGAHLVANCGTCHARGTFEGTLRQCADCHEDGTLVLATAKPARHVLTTDQCDACHATRSFVPLARMDHIETIGDCVSCHNNAIARGKQPDHPPAGDQCDDCHLTVTFTPAQFFQSLMQLDNANRDESTATQANERLAASSCDNCDNAEMAQR
ncbi:MAG: hypothetical protein AAF417_10205 [Pseudomonadota bacterium]